MTNQTAPLQWTGAGTAADPIRPLVPALPEGERVVWASADPDAGIVHYGTEPIPPEPEPEAPLAE